MGGIGNRLFQLAHAKSLQKYGEPVEVIEFPPLIEKIATIFKWSYHEIWLSTNTLASSLAIGYRKANLGEICRILLFYFLRKVFCFSLNFNQPLRDFKRKNRLRIGYFQSRSHLDGNAVQDVAFSVSQILGINMGDHKVIHIRGGDFNLQDRLSSEIFLRVLEQNPNIEVITNDQNYVRSICDGFVEPRFFSSGSAKTDFIRIASSKFVYPSDSTFGFWGAYIVKKNGGKIHLLTDNKLWDLL
jgi:hypothetical protein